MLHAYYKSLWRQSEKHLKSYLANANEEDLHQFRVQLKRIKTVVHVIEYAHPHFKIKPLKKYLKKLFAQSGLLRDGYLVRKMASKAKLPKEIINKLNGGNHQKLIEQLSALYQHRGHKLERCISATATQTKRVGKKQLNDFVATTLVNIKRQLAKPLNNKALHTLRKAAKDFLNMYKLLGNEIAKDINSDDALFLEKFQEMVGNKHDGENFTKGLARFKGQSAIAPIVSNLKKASNSEKQTIIAFCRQYQQQNANTT